MSTVIDVVLTEDRLTNARLGKVDAQLQYAQGLADLAFFTGRFPHTGGTEVLQLVTTLTSGSFDGK
jgi:hypothetical protein